nr:Uncharacterised protein [Klebsiella pneumoniae]
MPRWSAPAARRQRKLKSGGITLSGALSGYGQPSQKGLDIIQAITPTLKNGDTIKLIVIDDKSDKVEAANAMQRPVSSDKVDAVIGEVTSSNTGDDQNSRRQQNAAGLLHRHQRPRHPQPSLRQPGLLLGQLPGVVGANLASRDLKAKTAAIVFDSSNDYSVGSAKAFRTQFLKTAAPFPSRSRPRAAARTLKPSWRASRRRMST